MERQELLDQLNKIFRDVFDNPSIVINESTTSADVVEWDSLSKFQLVKAVEKHFNIKVTTAEIHNWKNVAGICDSIQKRFTNA